MTQNDQSSGPEPLRNAIQTQHPGIADEIRGAIKTLRKLQQITEPTPPGLPAPDGLDPAADATLAASMLPAPTTELADTELIRGSHASQRAGPAVPTLAASTSFGRYQIVRLLGRGAMGAVYLAYDPHLERYVALKTPVLGENPQIVERFYREARAAAQLRSPYLCPIFDVGQIGGLHYLTMAFIEGQSLERRLAEGTFTETQELANLIKKIARGLQKAHEHSIIHRDLKPANIMIDHDREPIVMDFGLAKRVDDDIQLTSPGNVLGTPAYMSPEQIEGDASKLGPATDIYSLGVILYQMLTGRLPFQGSLLSILRQISSAEPPKPSTIVPELPEDSPLECICLKLMAKSPSARFSSMTEVVNALDELTPGARAPVAKPTAWKKLRFWSVRIFTPRPRGGNLDTPRTSTSPEPSTTASEQITLADPVEPRSEPSTIAETVVEPAPLQKNASPNR